tara:strand:+ start:5760 stop:6359 length:600 start_codon:yes stop_codon:yes gene_type:complete
MTNFLDSQYQIIKQAISPDTAKISYQYLINKKELYFKTKKSWPKIIKDNIDFEMFGYLGDFQAPTTWCTYGDLLMETILINLRKKMEEITHLELDEQYAYARLYKTGDELKKHKDRFECEISTTLNLGGDLWPIYLEPDIKVELTPGDMLVYKGAEIAHWRHVFTGKECAQVFLHYTRKGTGKKYDSRQFLCLPKIFVK